MPLNHLDKLENVTRLKRLEKREWQLWTLAFLLLITYAICITLIAQPEVWSTAVKGSHQKTLLILLAGLSILTILLIIYIIYRERSIQKVRETIIKDERLKTMGNLSARLAHEVNNDLAVALGYLHLILTSDPPERLKGDLIKVNSELDSMHRTLRNVLVYHRQATPAAHTPISLTSIINATLDLLNNEFIIQSIRVSKNITADYKILAEAEPIREVFLNLFKNSIEAMSKITEGEKVLTVNVEEINRQCIIKVADTGPGIKPEIMKRLFEPFFTTKEIGVGTGLGLSIVQTIITGYGGKISAKNNPDKGVTFIIELPILKKG